MTRQNTQIITQGHPLALVGKAGTLLLRIYLMPRGVLSMPRTIIKEYKLFSTSNYNTNFKIFGKLGIH